MPVRLATLILTTAVLTRMFAAIPQGPTLMFPPITGLTVKDLYDSFEQKRGASRHEAIDIRKPRGTSVHAVVDGVIAKLFPSKPGGNTVYLFDNAQIYCYYHAHLDHYVAGLHEGQHVSPGHVMAYVGSTGNANPLVPHLHFTIFQLGPEKHWWQGTPINPYPILVQMLQVGTVTYLGGLVPASSSRVLRPRCSD